VSRTSINASVHGMVAQTEIETKALDPVGTKKCCTLDLQFNLPQVCPQYSKQIEIIRTRNSLLLRARGLTTTSSIDTILCHMEPQSFHHALLFRPQANNAKCPMFDLACAFCRCALPTMVVLLGRANGNVDALLGASDMTIDLHLASDLIGDAVCRITACIITRPSVRLFHFTSYARAILISTTLGVEHIAAQKQ